MLNIILAEDEPPILRDIKMQIEKHSEYFKVCASFYNGQQVLEYLEQTNILPDILITDIQMPGINGLELLHKIRKKYPAIICIILTGYGEFSYAQEALRMGVREYLLKPVEEKALSDLLTKLSHEKHIKEAQEQFHYKPVYTSDNDFVPFGTYVTAFLCFGTIPMLESPAHEFSTSFPNISFLESALSTLTKHQTTFWIIDGKSPMEKAIIFNFDTSDHKHIRYFFRQFFKEVCKNTFHISVAVEILSENINEIGASLQRLRYFLTHNILLEQSQLLFYPEESSCKNTGGFEVQTEIVQKLASVFSSLQVQLFQKSLKNSLSTVEKLKLPQNELFQFIYDLLNSCLASITSDRNVPNFNIMECTNDTLFLSRTYEQLYQNLSSVFTDIFESILMTPNNGIRKDQICLLIDTYIKKNYTKPINTQSLAEQFGFSPAYLSKVFREYKNISPMEYIIFLRIERAKMLFRESPSILIKDVSLAIGYEDPQYFSKVFKKITGTSPKQFLNHLISQ